MKKYESPEFELEKFELDYVLTTSGLDNVDNHYDEGDDFDF